MFTKVSLTVIFFLQLVTARRYDEHRRLQEVDLETEDLEIEDRTSYKYTMGQLKDQVYYLKKDVAALKELLEGFSLEYDSECGRKTLRLTGRNFQIVNGASHTATTNGCGNVVVGYNEEHTNVPHSRTGSHNIVTGKENGYNSWGGYVGGVNNVIANEGAVVMTGRNNRAGGQGSFVATGDTNLAASFLSAVISGYQNLVSLPAGDRSVVISGRNNLITGPDAAIIAGGTNAVRKSESVIIAGKSNTIGAVDLQNPQCAQGDASVIISGFRNQQCGFAAAMGAGRNNKQNTDRSFLAAGNGVTPGDGSGDNPLTNTCSCPFPAP